MRVTRNSATLAHDSADLLQSHDNEPDLCDMASTAYNMCTHASVADAQEDSELASPSASVIKLELSK
jgi:hypothetical protein